MTKTKDRRSAVEQRAAALIASRGKERGVRGALCAVTRSGQRELIDELLRQGMSQAQVAATARADLKLDLTQPQVAHHARHACRCWQ